ncbi:MAG: S-layer homology domain-containing protein, partial [Firmicutes bacterium]|nr:S-layer homology domain-containing protein [Bacillota bacterium]
MKNFKKVLALVLVLATLLGLATMASATEYKDADKIAADYDEAVKVLDLIETMQGYPNGEFRPTATITREEAAKLIAIFDNKDADISTYYTSINPFADEKGRWGESYVGYGYRAGIIAGMNANTFAPTANVTGTQFLKMALVTLGYDQEAEGFVGSSWAVNVLALARKLDLIDGLADGWKPEADLTRQEAAQILLNTLKADTVEYAQEAKSANWKPTENKDGVWTFGGKLYLTVAGAVKTGNKLYKDFKLAKDVSEDAFMRPYTKWVYDKDDDKTVEVMDSPKATFTTKFNACELLVALGVKENDTKTKKVIAEYYINGALVSEDEITLQHTASKCKLKTDEYEKYGAQGTLTQVFKMKNDKDETVYRICSIDTWLGKLAKVTKTTTSHDNHKKGEDLVQIVPFTVSNDGLDTKHNYHEYCTNSANHEDCGEFEFAGDTSNNEGYIAYDKPAGLAKDDYVLFTYSFKQDDNEDMGVQSVDVVTAKEGRLNGFKYADVADDPSETRIGGEYVKDAAHFHLGYDESKDTANFGTRGFFYDAYGNVIGMKDAADTSKYGVLDKVWVEYNKGVASIHANIVGLDAKVTEDVVVATIKYGDDKAVEVKPTTPDEIANKYELAVKDILSAITDISEQNYKAYYFVYDLLGKFETNTKGEYTLSRADDDYAYDDDANVTFVKGKPVLKIEGEDSIKVTANTEFLVRTDDVGTGYYVSWKGYTGSDVKSVVAHGYDIVKSD